MDKNCRKCGKPATKNLSSDPSIRGILTCGDCFEDCRIAYDMLLKCVLDKRIENRVEEYTKNWHEPVRLKVKSPYHE